jgi:hypothetical protein
MRFFYLSTILLLCFLFSIASSQSSREINKTIPLKSDGCLFIDTYKGSITISTYDKPQVELNVKIESDDSDSWDAAKDVEDTEIEIDGRDDEITFRTSYKKVKHQHYKDFWDWFTTPFESSYSLPLVHYTIKMPRTAALKIKDYKSNIRIDNVTSEIKLNTYKGEVDIDNLIGGIELETYKGRVRVSFSKIKNNSRFETYKGNITVEVPRENGFELHTEFERRVDFNTDFDVNTIGRGSRKHQYYDYRGEVNSGGPSLELISKKGDVRLKSK